MTNQLTWETFQSVDIRVGTILTAEKFEAARNPAYKLTIDFGTLGIKKTSAQITVIYQPNDLIGKQVTAVVNFPPKQIATMMSECLVLGVIGSNNAVTLLSPTHPVENGLRIG